MATKVALTTVPKSPTAEKKERERISLIEMPPTTGMVRQNERARPDGLVSQTYRDRYVAASIRPLRKPS